MAKTHNVNLKKALAEIRQWPGARTDRKVFAVIADYANDKGVTVVRQATISAAIETDPLDVSQSVRRLADRGFIKITREMGDGYYIHNRYTIAPAYMLNATDDGDDTAAAIAELSHHLDVVAIGVLAAEKAVYAQGPEIAANTARIEKLEKRIADLENAIKKANGNN